MRKGAEEHTITIRKEISDFKCFSAIGRLFSIKYLGWISLILRYRQALVTFTKNVFLHKSIQSFAKHSPFVSDLSHVSVSTRIPEEIVPYALVVYNAIIIDALTLFQADWSFTKPSKRLDQRYFC